MGPWSFKDAEGQNVTINGEHYLGILGKSQSVSEDAPAVWVTEGEGKFFF